MNKEERVYHLESVEGMLLRLSQHYDPGSLAFRQTWDELEVVRTELKELHAHEIYR